MNAPSSTGGSFAVTGDWKSIDGEGEVHEGTIAGGTLQVTAGGTSTPQTTGGASSPVFVQSIAAPPVTSEPNATAQQICFPASRRCEGKNLMVCSLDGRTWEIQECEESCENGECTEKKENESEPAPVPEGGTDITGQFLTQGSLIAGIAALGALGLLAAWMGTKRRKATLRYEFRPQA